MVSAMAQECISPCDKSVVLCLKIFPTPGDNALVRIEAESQSEEKKAEV